MQHKHPHPVKHLKCRAANEVEELGLPGTDWHDKAKSAAPVCAWNAPPGNIWLHWEDPSCGTYLRLEVSIVFFLPSLPVGPTVLLRNDGWFFYHSSFALPQPCWWLLIWCKCLFFPQSSSPSGQHEWHRGEPHVLWSAHPHQKVRVTACASVATQIWGQASGWETERSTGQKGLTCFLLLWLSCNIIFYFLLIYFPTDSYI